MYHRRFDYMHFAKALEKGDDAPLSLATSGAIAKPLAQLLMAGGFKVEHPLRDLKRCIAETYGVSADSVVLCLGTSQANALVALAYLRPGDECIVERPAYEALPGLADWIGATVVRLDRSVEDGCPLDFEALARLVTAKTKLVMLTHPHNPSGRPLTKDELVRLRDFARAHKLAVLVDEVYRDDLSSPPPVFADGREPCALTTSSLTKVYGLGALRLGWVIAEPGVAKKLDDLNDWLHVDMPAPSVIAALLAWPHLKAWRDESARLIAHNRATFDLWRVKTGKLPGTIFDAMPFFLARVDGDDWKFAEDLKKRGLALPPGSYFEAPGTTRVGFGRVTPEQLARALEILEG